MSNTSTIDRPENPALRLLHEQRIAAAESRQRFLAKCASGAHPSDAEQAEYKRACGEIDRLGELIQSELRNEQRDRDLDAAYEAAARKFGRAGRGAPALSSEDRELDQAFRSAILEKNPAPIYVPIEGRSYHQPGLEKRDLLKGTATQALPTSVYGRIVDHLVEQSAILRAGATLLSTETGEDLAVPKSTAFSSAAQVAEGALIGESDPTLGVTVLKSYKYGTYFEVSHELAQDGSIDLLNFLARQSATALAVAFGADLIGGDGSGKPVGALSVAGTGVTAPTGCSTSLGAQQTAGQGTDLLWSLYGSLAEPYVVGGRTAWLMRNASQTKIRQLKDSSGAPIDWPSDLGPIYVDPNVPAMAAGAKSMIFGDWSRYFLRIAEGIRFERSDSFKFQNDLAVFRCLLRLDGALVDTNALKVFVNSAT